MPDTPITLAGLPKPPQKPQGYGSWEDVMRLALMEAEAAGEREETPVGAVLLEPGGEVIARAGNESIARNDPAAHAEILALRKGGVKLRNYRLPGCILVVTLEPCLMCVGAMIHARIQGLVFGAPDPKTGAAVSNLQGPNLAFTNHKFWVLGGVLALQCGSLLKNFFARRR